MDNEKLIQLVKESRIIYDVSDKRYSDIQRKDETWKEIAIKLGSNEKDCKKTWSLLRDAFRRALKKRRDAKRDQNGYQFERKWKFEEEMSFLLPYLKDRSSAATGLASDDGSAEIDDKTDSQDVDEAKLTVNYFPEEILPGPLDPLNVEVSVPVPIVRQKSPDPDDTPTLPPKRLKKDPLKKTSTEETPSTTLMKYILENKNKPPDDIEQFFSGIITTVRSFPPKERAIAKAKVFEIVSKMEIDILSRAVSTESPSPVSRPSSISPELYRESKIEITPTQINNGYPISIQNSSVDLLQPVKQEIVYD